MPSKGEQEPSKDPRKGRFARAKERLFGEKEWPSVSVVFQGPDQTIESVVEAWTGAIQKQLDETPGKVAVYGVGPVYESRPAKLISDFVRRGYSVREAMVETEYSVRYEHGHERSREELREKFHLEETELNKRMYEAFDILHFRSNRRLLWEPEVQDAPTLHKMEDIGLEEFTFTGEPVPVTDQLVTEELARIQSRGELMRTRHERMGTDVARIIARRDVSAGVVFTPLSDLSLGNQLSTMRNKSGQPIADVEYVFPPLAPLEPGHYIDQRDALTVQRASGHPVTEEEVRDVLLSYTAEGEIPEGQELTNQTVNRRRQNWLVDHVTTREQTVKRELAAMEEAAALEQAFHAEAYEPSPEEPNGPDTPDDGGNQVSELRKFGVHEVSVSVNEPDERSEQPESLEFGTAEGLDDTGEGQETESGQPTQGIVFDNGDSDTNPLGSIQDQEYPDREDPGQEYGNR